MLNDTGARDDALRWDGDRCEAAIVEWRDGRVVAATAVNGEAVR